MGAGDRARLGGAGPGFGLGTGGGSGGELGASWRFREAWGPASSSACGFWPVRRRAKELRRVGPVVEVGSYPDRVGGEVEELAGVGPGGGVRTGSVVLEGVRRGWSWKLAAPAAAVGGGVATAVGAGCASPYKWLTACALVLSKRRLQGDRSAGRRRHWTGSEVGRRRGLQRRGGDVRQLRACSLSWYVAERLRNPH